MQPTKSKPIRTSVRNPIVNKETVKRIQAISGARESQIVAGLSAGRTEYRQALFEEMRKRNRTNRSIRELQGKPNTGRTTSSRKGIVAKERDRQLKALSKGKSFSRAPSKKGVKEMQKARSRTATRLLKGRKKTQAGKRVLRKTSWIK